MGHLLRGNTTSIGRYNEEEVPVIEGYGSDPGAYLRIIAEASQQELSVFDESMKSEMNEIAAEIAKADLEAKGMFTEAAKIEIVTEGFADIKSKLKSMVMKAWQKIKSLYEAVKVRVSAFLTRDYNKFYKKHQHTFGNYAKNTKGKYSFKMPKSTLDLSALKYGSFESKAHTTLKKCENKKEEEIKSEKEKISDGSYLESLLGCSRSDYKIEVYSQLFEDKDDHEQLSDAIIKEVQTVLGTKDIIVNLNKAQKSNNDYYKKLLSEIDSMKSTLNKSNDTTDERHEWKNSTFGQDKNNTNSVYLKDSHPIDSMRLELFSNIVSVNQTANNIINGEYISLIKMHIAQCKSVFTKVVSRSKFTEQTLLDAIEENAVYESLEFLNA